jgi:hypothetical protein
MAQNTTYFNGFNKVKKGQYSIKISGNTDKLIEEINKHRNSKGYINLELKERKEPDQYGNTHFIVLDTWEPNKQQPVKKQFIEDVEDDGSNLPF